mgnify:CR=1 FL=1
MMRKNSMTEEKKERLETDGFQIGSVAEFLNLTPEEQAKRESPVAHATGKDDENRREPLRGE